MKFLSILLFFCVKSCYKMKHCVNCLYSKNRARINYNKLCFRKTLCFSYIMENDGMEFTKNASSNYRIYNYDGDNDTIKNNKNGDKSIHNEENNDENNKENTDENNDENNDENTDDDDDINDILILFYDDKNKDAYVVEKKYKDNYKYNSKDSKIVKNTLFEELKGYDNRYPKTYCATKDELYRLKILNEKKQLLEILENNDVSILTKLQLIEKEFNSNKIGAIKLMNGGLMDDYNYTEF